MTTILMRFKSGLYTATQSFSMLWQQKKLLVYLGIPAGLNIILRLLLHNTGTPLKSFKLASVLYQIFLSFPLWAHKVGLFVLFLATTMITTFFTVALIYRIAQTIQGVSVTFWQSFTACWPKRNIIALWALPLALIDFLINSMLDSTLLTNFSLSATCILLIGLILWFLYTFFVLQLIALNNMPFGVTVQRSGMITKHTIVEIIGVECWFTLTIILVTIPFLVMELLFKNIPVNPILVFLGLFISEFMLKCWLTTAHIIAKTMLYQSYCKESNF